MTAKLRLLGQSTMQHIKQLAPVFLALALLFAFAVAPHMGSTAVAAVGKGASALYAVSPTAPVLDIDFSSALTTIFDYASMIFGALIGVAAIGIGFNFGLGLIGWVSKMISQAVKF